MMYTQNPLYVWLQTHGFWVKSSSSSSSRSNKKSQDAFLLTHVFLDGGRACVPEESLPEFWTAYMDAIKVCDQHVVERISTPSGNFKMFLDIDIKISCSSPSDNDDENQNHVDIILACLPRELRHGAITILHGQKTTQDASTTVKKKLGIHLVWDRVVVNASTAMALRDEIVSKCREADVEKDWDDVIDGSVYRSGLRMPYSCKGMSRDMCSVYVPKRCVDFLSSDGSMNTSVLETMDPLVGIAKTSIHMDPTRPKSFWSVVVKKQKRQDSSISSSTASISSSSSSLTTVEAKIRAHLPPVYSNSVFTKVHRHATHTTVHMDSRYCHNLQRDHHSNRVYLYVDAQGIWQRCFCRCVTTQGRLSGCMCKDYSYLLYPHDVLGYGLNLRRATSSLTVSGNATNLDFWCKKLLAM